MRLECIYACESDMTILDVMVTWHFNKYEEAPQENS